MISLAGSARRYLINKKGTHTGCPVSLFLKCENLVVRSTYRNGPAGVC
jgi:hypothetical protein